MDSLNVGVSPNVRVGHDRFPGGLFWNTRYDGFTGGSHFTLGWFGLDRDGHDGEVPAARFSTRSPDETLGPLGPSVRRG